MIIFEFIFYFYVSIFFTPITGWIFCCCCWYWLYAYRYNDNGASFFSACLLIIQKHDINYICLMLLSKNKLWGHF